MEGIVDSHTHVALIPYDGLQNMALAGVRKIVGCSLVFAATHAASLFDHFDQLTGLCHDLVSKNGMDLYLAIGVHPMGIPHDWPRVIEALPSYLNRDGIIALGEIGLHEGSKLEEDVLREQFRVAKEHNVPVILHTPPRNREAITAKTIEIAASVGMPPEKMIIDHVNLDILDQVEAFGAVPGLTVNAMGLTPQVLLDNLEKFQRGVLNSDYSNLKPNDPVSVPKVVQFLELNGAQREIIARIARTNGEAFFGF